MQQFYLRKYSARFLSMLILGCMVYALHAQLQTSPIVHSGMVVQRHHAIPLWGTVYPGSKVFAVLNGSIDSTMALVSGEWEIRLPAMAEGGPYLLTLHSGDDTLLYTDVYVGDVWLASGQSNMAMRLEECNNAAEEIAGSDNPEIRQFLVKKILRNSPLTDIADGSNWTPATPEHVGYFTAVGYYFAKYLYAYLDIPIGIINTSYGGTRIESWMSNEMLGYDETSIVFGDGESYLQPTVAYNAMLAPLTRVPVKGIIWYQGEANRG